MTYTMMNCEVFDSHLNAYVRGQLGVNTHIAMRDHAVSCPHCSDLAEERKAYLATLNSVTVPNLTSAKSDRLIANAKQRGRSTTDRYGFVKGFAAASILAVAVFLGVSQLNHNDVASESFVTAGLATPSHLDDLDAREITLIIHSPSQMESAQLVIQLPVDIAIAGEEHLSEVEYIVDLHAGENRIVLPIVSEPYAMYASDVKLQASLHYKNGKKDFELDVDLTPPQNSNAQPG